jgi:RNA exonuclease 1
VVSVTIIDCNEKLLLQEFIRPEGELKNLRTEITGLKVEDLHAYTKSLEEVLPVIQQIASAAILVGHDLSNDMRVLKFTHQHFVDTVALFPHKDRLPFKTKLRDLSLSILKQPIQYGKHDPIEDATAALRLAKWHISNGRGTVEYVPGEEITPHTLEEICR